jgi:hypothetical protein
LKSQLKEKEENCGSMKKNYNTMIDKFTKIKQKLIEEIGKHKLKHDGLAQELRIAEDKLRNRHRELDCLEQDFGQVGLGMNMICIG